MKLWENGSPLFNEEYGQPQPELQLYLLDTDKPLGCIVVCPGGGYAGLAGHEAEPFAKMFNEAGYHAVVLRYRCAPYKHPCQLLDVQRAIRTVRYYADEWRVKADSIAVCGSSAGGHLALMAAEQYDNGIEGDEIDAVSSRPDAAILCYAVSTLGEYTHAGTRDNLTGGDPELCEALTGEKNLPDDAPPMFIWHTAEDGAVPVQNALIMGMKLKEKNIPFEMHIFPEGPHGVALFYDVYPYPTKWAELCVNWLRHIGF